MKITILSLATLIMLVGCKNNHMPVTETKITGGTTPISKGTVGFDQVKPIFEAKCIMCHNGSTHPKNWTNYDTSKADLIKLNERLFVLANMPSVGSLSPSEKTLIKAWLAGGGALVSSSAPTTEPIPTTPDQDPVPGPIPDETGAQIVQNKCMGCHGSDAAAMDTPVIHGLDKNYLQDHLEQFKTGTRKDLIMGGTMNAIAQSLTDDETQKVVVFLKSESNCSITVQADPGTGNIDAGMAKAQVCMGCHTDTPSTAPVIDGQKAGYLRQTLQNFRSANRVDYTMNAMAASLSDEDINDIAAYFNSKRNCK